MSINIGINNKNLLVVDFPYDKDLVKIIQGLPTRQFNKKLKLWSLPLIDLFILKNELKDYVERNNVKLTITDKAKEKYLELIKYYKTIKSLGELKDTEYEYNDLKKDFKLYPFQKVGAKFLEEIEKGLLALDVGLGKSVVSLSATSNLMSKGKVKKSLIICPASLKFNWAIEIAKFSDYSYTIIGGDKEKRTEQYKNTTDFTIMNYELLRFDIDNIIEVAWDLVIADEVQRIKNYSTITSKNIKRLTPNYVFALTGTPIENSLMDLYTIMRFVNPKIYGGNALTFKQRYCNTDSYGTVISYRKENFHEIETKNSYCMIRRKKRDVLEDLPERIDNFYYINLNEKEKKVYNIYKKQVINDINSSSLNYIDTLARIVFLREICDCINLVDPSQELTSSKLQELNNILSDLPQESKIIIFTEYERMAKIIEENIPYKSVHLHGSVKNDCKLERESEKEVKKNNKDLIGKDLDLKIHEEKLKCVCQTCPYYSDDFLCNTRKKIISKFNNEPDVKVFISTNAGKEGLNLQVANTIVNYDLSFNPATNEQRIGRIDRIGQKSEKILVINLVCHETIEERIIEVLKIKQDLFDKVIDKTDTDILKKLDKNTLVSLL